METLRDSLFYLLSPTVSNQKKTLTRSLNISLSDTKNTVYYLAPLISIKNPLLGRFYGYFWRLPILPISQALSCEGNASVVVSDGEMVWARGLLRWYWKIVAKWRRREHADFTCQAVSFRVEKCCNDAAKCLGIWRKRYQSELPCVAISSATGNKDLSDTSQLISTNKCLHDITPTHPFFMYSSVFSTSTSSTQKLLAFQHRQTGLSSTSLLFKHSACSLVPIQHRSNIPLAIYRCG